MRLLELCCKKSAVFSYSTVTWKIGTHKQIRKWCYHCPRHIPVLSCFSHVWLCGPMDCSLPASSVHGILQARILEQVAISFSRVSSQPRNQSQVSCISGRFFTIWAIREALQKGIFRAMKLYCVILHWWMHVTIHLSKLIDCTTPRMNPNLNYGPWMMMVYQSWFISFNKCTILAWALIVGVTSREKHGGYRNLLYVPLSFSLNLKLIKN